MKTAIIMIEMKVEAIIIGTKNVSVNQVLITIRLKPVARIKQNAISDTVFNVPVQVSFYQSLIELLKELA